MPARVTIRYRKVCCTGFAQSFSSEHEPRPNLKRSDLCKTQLENGEQAVYWGTAKYSHKHGSQPVTKAARHRGPPAASSDGLVAPGSTILHACNMPRRLPF